MECVTFGSDPLRRPLSEGSRDTMNSIRSIAALAALCAAALSGCAKYDFLLIEPAEFARTIDETPSDIERGSLRYSLAESGSHLGVRVTNLSDDPLRLLGERSFVVDPEGGSHALTSGVIAPASHITISLPPVPQRIYRPRSSIGIGVGVGSFSSHSHSHTGVFTGTTFGDPDYYYASTGDDWRWKTGLVRLRLVYQAEQPGSNLSATAPSDRAANEGDAASELVIHEFLFERQRAE